MLATLVFTDIQGSTPLWQADPDAMREALAVHDRVLRELLQRHHGYEFGTAGDAFKVSFSSPADAVRFCADAQLALRDAPWPDALLHHEAAAEVRDEAGRVLFRGLRVRMGVHLGEVEVQTHPTTGRSDYFGPAVNAAARIGDAGHGGQIVASRLTWDAARRGGAEAACRELGPHKLRGVAEPEELVQLDPFGLEGRRFPPIRTETARRTNVVPRVDRFLGRDEALSELAGTLRSCAGIVTLLGPGGTGKTRLATELCARTVDEWPGGTWFCDLATARSRMDVLVLISGALRFPLAVGVTEDDAIAAVGRAFGQLGRALLVLDNFEQVTGVAARMVAEWRRVNDQLGLLVTSRQPLSVAGEVRVELPPLALDDGVALFESRARQVRPAFSLKAERVHVEAIVRQLDGMPLAIELAASRADVLSPKALAQRLGERFRILATSRGDLTSRQATLRGAMDWSWDLLEPPEREALAQCAVFRGGFTMDAAEAVIALSGDGFVIDVVQSLRRKSLLRTELDADELRLGMYETVLAYADEKLGPDRAAVEARHAAFYADSAEEWASGLRAPGDVECLRKLRSDLDNLLAVQRRFPTSEAAVRVVNAIAPALELFGPAPVFLEMVGEAVRAAEALGEPRLLAQALRGRAFALGLAAEGPDRQRDIERAHELAVRHDLPDLVAETLRERGMGMFYGTYDRDGGLADLDRAAELYGQLGMRAHQVIARGLWQQIVSQDFRDVAIDAVAENAAAIRQHGGTRDTAWMLTMTAILHMMTGRDPALMVGALEEAEAAFDACGDRLNQVWARTVHAFVLAGVGDYERAERKFDDAIRMAAGLSAPGREAGVRILRGSVATMRARDARDRGDLAEMERLLAGTEPPIRAIMAQGGVYHRSGSARFAVAGLQRLRELHALPPLAMD